MGLFALPDCIPWRLDYVRNGETFTDYYDEDGGRWWLESRRKALSDADVTAATLVDPFGEIAGRLVACRSRGGQMSEARVARFTCEQHGEIWSEAVYCSHDTEAVVRAVAEAHRKPYGANCRSIITVDLLDPETMAPDVERRLLHPPLAAADSVSAAKED